MRTATFVAAVTALAGVGLGAETAPTFTRKPAAVRSGDRVRISFAVDRETDVAVYVEDAEGSVVRHLVAGQLGRNPPPPLTPGSLAQTIEWDGKADYGRTAAGFAGPSSSAPGPFRVRVALGTGVRYDRVLLTDPNALNNVKGLAAGPTGTVYVLNATGGAIWSGDQLLAFGRDGRYERTLVPFPADLTMQRVQAFGAFELRGRPAALVQYHRLTLAPNPPAPRKTGMAVTPDGKVVLRLTDGLADPYQHIAAAGADGSAIWEDPAGPPLLTKATPPDADGRYRGGFTDRPMLAVSSDGKWAYVAGLKPNRFRDPAYPAVFRVPLPARGPAEPFFGDWTKTGAGKDALGGAPRGLAVDGRGNLFVADHDNDRVVVVSEKDGRYAGEFAVEKPDCLAVHPTTGAVYLTRLRGRDGVELVKVSNWKDAKVAATLPRRHEVNPGFPWLMTLDGAADPPVVWMGADRGTLLRIEDRGETFAVQQVNSPEDTNGSFLDLSVDRFRKDREIYARCNNGWWYRHNEATGATEKVLLGKNAGLHAGGGAGKQILAGADGNLYALGYPCNMYRLTRDARPLAWEEPNHPADAGGRTDVKWAPFASYVPVNMTDMCHTLGARADGHLFILHPLVPGGRAPKALHEYLPTGRKITENPIIWKVSAGAVGPRFDAAGNIYIAEILHPAGRPYPEEFDRIFGQPPPAPLPSAGPQGDIGRMYGSIVKFSPRGGMIHFPSEKPRPTRMSSVGIDPYEGEPVFDPALKSMEATYYDDAGRAKPVRVTGAEWLAFGYSHVDVGWCTCETTRFDVDEFGRVWFPDLCLHQVRVLDTNGNPLFAFGNYGNAESAGPDGPVVDPTTGKVRARRPDDPKDLKSPFAEPEIAFAWLVGVVATDRYVYTGDSVNRRMLRLKLVHAAEATCEIGR